MNHSEPSLTARSPCSKATLTAYASVDIVVWMSSSRSHIGRESINSVNEPRGGWLETKTYVAVLHLQRPGFASSASIGVAWSGIWVQRWIVSVSSKTDLLVVRIKCSHAPSFESRGDLVPNNKNGVETGRVLS